MRLLEKEFGKSFVKKRREETWDGVPLPKLTVSDFKAGCNTAIQR